MCYEALQFVPAGGGGGGGYVIYWEVGKVYKLVSVIHLWV